MRKILSFLILIAILLRAESQTVTNILVNPVTSYGGGGLYVYVSPNYFTNIDGGSSGWPTAAYTAGSSNWLFYNGATVLSYTTNTPAVPANGAVYPLYTNGVLMTNFGYPYSARFFTSIGSDLIMDSNVLSGFWATTGSKVSFYAAGFNNSSANYNVLKVTLGVNILFQSPPTAGRGSAWRMDGVFNFDGTNMASSIQYLSGDTNNPTSGSFLTITNAAITNQSFTIALAGNYDTNLVITSGSIYSTIVVPPATTPAALSLAPSPGVWQTLFTVTNSTDSSYGYGAGLMRWDTNYIYVTYGTNLWKRAALIGY